MKVQFQPIPSTWPSATEKTVTIKISSAPPGQIVDIDVTRSLPKPDKLIDHTSVVITNSGTAIALFDIVLKSRGVNVLHVEANCMGSNDSDSVGTVVT